MTSIETRPIFVFKDVEVLIPAPVPSVAHLDFLSNLEFDLSDLELTVGIVDCDHRVGHLVGIEDILVKVYDHVGRSDIGSAAAGTGSTQTRATARGL